MSPALNAAKKEVERTITKQEITPSMANILMGSESGQKLLDTMYSYLRQHAKQDVELAEIRFRVKLTKAQKDILIEHRFRKLAKEYLESPQIKEVRVELAKAQEKLRRESEGRRYTYVTPEKIASSLYKSPLREKIREFKPSPYRGISEELVKELYETPKEVPKEVKYPEKEKPRREKIIYPYEYRLSLGYPGYGPPEIPRKPKLPYYTLLPQKRKEKEKKAGEIKKGKEYALRPTEAEAVWGLTRAIPIPLSRVTGFEVVRV